METISETLIDAEEVAYYYDGMKPGLEFEEYVLSTVTAEKVRMPFVRFTGASLFSPLEASKVVLKLTPDVRPAPPDVGRFLGGLSESISNVLTATGVPNKPVVSVTSAKNGGKLKFEVGRTFLHDVFVSHHVADLKIGGETIRNIFAGETVRFAKRVENPLLPAPLRLDVVFLSRDGLILLTQRGSPFSADKRVLSPVIVYPPFPFGRDFVTLSDLVRLSLPEELVNGSLIRVFSTHVDLRTLGEVVVGVVIVSNKPAVELKQYLGRTLPLNVVRLPKFKDFGRKRVTVMRVIAESIQSFSNTIGVSYGVFALMNE